MVHHEKKETPLDLLAVGKTQKKRTIFDFFDATNDIFLEYMQWKKDTDLWFFELYGQNIEVKGCNFLQWLEWRRIDSLNIESEDLTIEAAFEEVF